MAKPISPWIELTLLGITCCFVGCNPGPQMAPVRGSVSLDGQPLHFGVVMLHPDRGQVAQATIGPDGLFEVSTFEPGDGAPLGGYAVSVLCYEGHDPGRQAKSDGVDGFLLGKSLIPLRYTRASSSGLTIEVPAEGVSDYEIQLHASRR